MIRRVLGILGTALGLVVGIVVLAIAVLATLLILGWRGLHY